MRAVASIFFFILLFHEFGHSANEIIVPDKYGGPQLSHQNQMLTSNSNRSHQIQIAHSKFKSLTANSNRSQQIQITHSKLQITHSKLQIAHSKFKSPTANSNRPQQIQIVHSKLKSLTANSNCSQQITFR